MSSKKLGGLDKKISSKKLNLSGPGGKTMNYLRASLGDPTAMFSEEVVGGRAGSSGTSSADRDEDKANAADVETEREANRRVQEEATAKQAEIDAKNALDEEAREKLRQAQGSGYASNILAGRKDFGYGGGARRKLSGS